MNLNKLTQKSQLALQTAQDIARNYNHQAIEPIHIFLAIIQESEGLAAQTLKAMSVDVDLLKIKSAQELERLPKIKGAGDIELFLSRDSKELLNSAFKEADALKDEFLSVEHILLALSAMDKSIHKLFVEFKISRDGILKALAGLRGNKRVTDQNPEDKYQVLSKYGRNLNELAKKGKTDPVIGREEEVRRTLQILSRRTKNNPILIGEPGVGKTAIVEGIAQRIVNNDVPESLKTKTIIALDMGALISGAQFRGQFEERLKAVVKEVVDSDGEIILFIDEVHTIVGAGATQGSMDASNILKPALARGELRCIGATTFDEYQKYIEKDAALERRFQKLIVNEPSLEDTISILRGLKEKYELHHGIRISDSAIIAAAKLSSRYIPDRFLPDKAIDLIDEAASKARIEIDSMPDELDALERKLRQLEIERQALLSELSDK